MAEKNPPLGNLEAAKAEVKVEKRGITRRSLLVHGGMAAVALSAVGRGSSAVAETLFDVETGTVAPRGGPLLGALYKADHTSFGEHWARMKEVPALGLYDSSLAGTIDTHVMMARQAGISFFVVPYSAGRAVDASVAQLLARGGTHGWFKTALLIEPDEDSRMLARARRTGLLGNREYVDHAADWLLGRYDELQKRGWLDHAGYLRDAEGRRISGFFRWDSPDATVAVIKRVLERRPALADEHRFWYAGTQEVGDHLRTVANATVRDQVTWFALHPELEQGWDRSLDLYRRLSRGGHRVVAVSPSYSGGERGSLAPRDAGQRLARQLAAVRQLNPAPTHVVVNSFNDWSNATSVEPGVQSGNRYLQVLAGWSAARA